MLDAYTIRKIAPRLLFAVIGVNLSIYLCVAAVDITNVVGHGIAQLIRAPFDVGGTLNSTVDAGAGNVAAPVFAAGALAGFVAIKGSLATIFALMLPVFVIIILAVLTLVIRQALLILLTLVSPVAIVLSVLPGTERFFRQWLDLFFRTLIIYPMVAALFAVSDVLTAISFNSSNLSSNTAGSVHVIAGVMFAFMPIALIPFTFRLAGGVLGAFSNATGNLRSMANQFATRQFQQNLGKGYQKISGGGLFKNTRERGTGKYLKNDKGEYIDKQGNVVDEADRIEEMERHGLRHRMNKYASRAANAHRFATGGVGGVVAASERAMIRQAAAVKESEEAKALAGFDDEMFVLANYGKSNWHDALIKRAGERFDYNDKNASQAQRDERKKNLNNAIYMMDAYNRVGGSTATRAAAAVELHGISTSYKSQYALLESEDGPVATDGNGKALLWDPEKHDASLKGESLRTSHDQMQETILNASGGERGLGNWIAAQSISGAKQAGRYDMAASASAVLMYQEALRSGDAKAVGEMKKYYQKMMTERITPAQALQGHPRAAEEMANALDMKLSDLTAKMSGDNMKNASMEEMQKLQEDYVRTIADISGYHDVLSSSGSEAVGHFDKLLGKKIKTTNADGKIIETSVAHEVEANRRSEVFVRRSRQYGGIEGMEHTMTEEEMNAASKQAIAENQAEANKAGVGKKEE